MECIVISESQLKITLSDLDMAQYGLTEEELTCAAPKTGEAFRHLCREAGASVGFTTQGVRLLIQFYASKEGGGELFVTRLPESPAPHTPPPLPLPEPTAPKEPSLSPGERSLLRHIHTCPVEPPHPISFGVRLETLEELLSLCHRLKEGGFKGESRAYATEESPRRWYLCLKLPHEGGITPPRWTALLSEYGQTVEGEATELYLSEHGRLICTGRAVEQLGDL